MKKKEAVIGPIKDIYIVSQQGYNFVGAINGFTTQWSQWPFR